MAAYHLTLKIGKKGKAAPHFNYICAKEKYAAKRGVIHIEHGNMPKWAAKKPILFWQASDEFERANGTAYRELEVSLPRELPLAQQINLAKQLAEEACGNNHAFSFAIHNTKASDGGMNPHLHLQFSERIDDGIERDPNHYFKRANKTNPENGGCLKDRVWQAQSKRKTPNAGYKSQSSEKLLAIREIWQTICNQALDDFGVIASIDCRSHADRGIKLTPQPKVGMKSWYLQKSTEKITIDPETKEKIVIIIPGKENERFKRWQEVVQANAPIICDMDKLEQQNLESHLAELTESKECINKALNELKLEKPTQQTRDKIITDLLPSTPVGIKSLAVISEARDKLDSANARYDSYCLIMDAPIRWGNIGAKIACLWSHSMRAHEVQRLQEANQSYDQTQQNAANLLKRAKEDPIMHTMAKPTLEREEEAVRDWQQKVDVLEGRLSAIEASLQSTTDSLDLLNQKHPNMNAQSLENQQHENGLHLSLTM